MKTRTTTFDLDEMIGNLLSPIGCPVWCAGMRTEIQNYVSRHKEAVEGLAACLAAIRQYEVWKHVKDIKGKPFASFEEMCVAARPFGLGCNPAELERIIAGGTASK